MEDRKPIYVVFGGCYSDWYHVGYFENKEDAEKYVVNYNSNEGYDEYFINEIKPLKLNEKLNDIKVKRYQKVVFRDTRYSGKYEMADEPDRYDIYTGENKQKQIKARGCWISFELTCDDRKRAEKIAQDKLSEVLHYKNELGSLEKAISLVQQNWK